MRYVGFRESDLAVIHVRASLFAVVGPILVDGQALALDRGLAGPDEAAARLFAYLRLCPLAAPPAE